MSHTVAKSRTEQIKRLCCRVTQEWGLVASWIAPITEQTGRKKMLTLTRMRLRNPAKAVPVVGADQLQDVVLAHSRKEYRCADQ